MPQLHGRLGPGTCTGPCATTATLAAVRHYWETAGQDGLLLSAQHVAMDLLSANGAKRRQPKAALTLLSSAGGFAAHI
jgi:hypothetical protein